MKRAVYMLIAAALAVGAFSALRLVGADSPTPVVGGIPAITKPSEDRTLSFVQPGLVSTVAVKEGDTVKAGDVVAKLDDEVEQKALMSDQAKSEDTTQIEAESMIQKQKAKDEQKNREAYKNGGVSILELESAELDTLVAGARVKLAEFQHRLDKLKYDEDAAAMKRRIVKSPISGIIDKIYLQEGEAADGQNSKSVRVVQIDPLWIETPVPISRAMRLKEGDMAQVQFRINDETLRKEGKVTHISNVGDAATESVLVRVEVPNPTNIPSGMKVLVSFGPVNKVASGQP